MSDELLRDIAREILAQQVPCKEHPMPFPKPSCWTCGRNGAFHHAALIAAGVAGLLIPKHDPDPKGK